MTREKNKDEPPYIVIISQPLFVIGKNPINRDHIKHIVIGYHFIRESFQNEDI